MKKIINIILSIIIALLVTGSLFIWCWYYPLIFVIVNGTIAILLIAYIIYESFFN